MTEFIYMQSNMMYLIVFPSQFNLFSQTFSSKIEPERTLRYILRNCHLKFADKSIRKSRAPLYFGVKIMLTYCNTQFTQTWQTRRGLNTFCFVYTTCVF